MRILLDTNILIDYFAQRHPHYESSRKLLILCALGEFEAWISASQLTDVFYLLTSGPKKLSTEEAKNALRKLRQILHICSVGAEEIDMALTSTWSDFEDACIFQAAVKVKAHALITRNAKDFEKSSITVLDCESLFHHLEHEQGLIYE